MMDNDLGKSTRASELITVDIVVETLRASWNEQLRSTVVEINGTQVSLCWSKTGQGGVRYWFICPITQKRCQKLYFEPSTGRVGSRGGLGIPYASQQQKGMLEEVTRTKLKNGTTYV